MRRFWWAVVAVVTVAVQMAAGATPAHAQTPPVAHNDFYLTQTDRPLHYYARNGLLANDTDADGDPLTAVLVNGPSNGSVIVRPNGSFTFRPNAGFSGYDYFVYRALDGESQSTIAFVELTIVGTPTPAADSYRFARPRPFRVASPGVLANDIYQGPVTISTLKAPQHGRLLLARDGGFRYAPDRHFNGTDRFTYRLTTGRFHASARVTIKVSASNVAPVAKPDSYTTNEDQQLDVVAPGLLANDHDADGDPLAIEIVSGPSGGVDIAADGSFSYTPYQDSDGDDAFTYRVTDGIAWSATVRVSIDVIAVNDPPVVEGEQYETAYETPLEVAAPGVLANDYDPIEFDGLSASGPIQGPLHGTVVLQSNGAFTYAPDPGFSGTDYFTYLVSDSQPGGIADAEITVDEPTG